MGLRLKFNLILGSACLVGLVIAAALAYRTLQQNARDEVLHSAGIMMASAKAIRSYTVNEVRPLLALQMKRAFMPQTVPAYAATQNILGLRETYPDYTYKEATLNPTNPTNRAVDWEADLIDWFRNHPDDTELVGERDTPTGRSLYLSRPIKVGNEGCLVCHSTPDAAPATMVSQYGTANGFGWQLNEIIGAQIVSVPMSVSLQRAQKTFFAFVGYLAGVFVFIGILANVLLNTVVIKRIVAMSKVANDVSMGATDIPELTVTGTDEIASLATSFNRMRRSLGNAMKMLDETMSGDSR